MTSWTDGRGQAIAHFHANTSRDTDGDMGYYKRSDLDRAPADGITLAPTDLVFEYTEVTNREDPEAPATRTAVMAPADRAALEDRDDHPFLHFFESTSEYGSWFQTAHALFNQPGVDPQDLRRHEAQAFMGTERYRAMRQVMLSVTAGP